MWGKRGRGRGGGEEGDVGDGGGRCVFLAWKDVVEGERAPECFEGGGWIYVGHKEVCCGRLLEADSER